VVRPKIGIVLGGGGAKAFAHLGIIDELRENKIPIDYIVSSSMGSLVGVLIANNVSSEEIKKEFYQLTSRVHWLKPTISRRSFMSQAIIIKLLKKLITKKNIEDLNIPISIVATDLIDGEQHIFSKGDIIQAVCASSAYPGIYNPVKIDNMILFDGGIVNNIPADICRKKIGKNNIVISCILDDSFKATEKSLDSQFKILFRAIYTPVIKSRQKIINKNSDIIIKPFKDFEFTFNSWQEIFKFYNIGKLEEFYNLGRLETKKHIKQIKKKLNEEK